MKLAQRFELKTKWSDEITYLAVKHADSETYTISWNDEGTQHRREFTTEQVAGYIIDATWRVIRVTVDGNGATLPDLSAQIDVAPEEGSFEAEQPYVFGEVKYVDEKLDVIELSSFGLDFELFEDKDGKYELRDPSGTVQYRYEREEIDLFVSQGFWSYRGTDVQTAEPEYLPPDDIEPVATFGAELESVRRFCEENEGWYVEVDADFYAVKNYDAEGVVFTVANEAQLAEVMQAIRVLNKYEDRG